MESGPPAEKEPPQEPDTESFLAALLVDDAQVVVDSVTGKAAVSKRKRRSGDSGDPKPSQETRP
ncbi:MAG TPA: hypothetical protein VKF28_03870 [Candidatus Dormibacteraeota bacterium]|nr:hypothetical protein [Candidatus Dormibacteraeota bacterium]